MSRGEGFMTKVAFLKESKLIRQKLKSRLGFQNFTSQEERLILGKLQYTTLMSGLKIITQNLSKGEKRRNSDMRDR
jgi:hypothetical protein